MQEREFSCVDCCGQICTQEDKENYPNFCPMKESDEIYQKAFEIITSDELTDFYKMSCFIEKYGKLKWPRVKETIELIKRMKYKKVGLAFCKALSNEAKIFASMLEAEEVEVITAMCKTGSIDKALAGVDEKIKISPGNFEAMCNPVAQAMILNKAKTDFNVMIGLCVGHDSFFYKYSEAMVTTLLVKDRHTGHNPAVVLYLKDGTFKRILEDESL